MQAGHHGRASLPYTWGTVLHAVRKLKDIMESHLSAVTLLEAVSFPGWVFKQNCSCLRCTEEWSLQRSWEDESCGMSMHVCVCAGICMYACVCMHLCTRMPAYKCLCACACMSAPLYVYTRVDVCTCTRANKKQTRAIQLQGKSRQGAAGAGRGRQEGNR